MPTSLTNDELAVIAAGTLAETAFLTTELSTEEPAWENDWVCAVVPFEAEVTGRVVVAAPAPLAAQVAADMLGVDSGSDEAKEQAGTAVAELANALAGNVVARLFGAQGEWQLGFPRATSTEPSVAPGERANRITLLNDAGRPIRVEVVLADMS